jgi:ABC-type phosphate/phosphonate transport system permease subunit
MPVLRLPARNISVPSGRAVHVQRRQAQVGRRLISATRTAPPVVGATLLTEFHVSVDIQQRRK